MVERAGRVEGKVAIVTGAGSTPGPGVGTGKATAIVLAREGARVLLVDLHPERAEETRSVIEEEGGTADVFARNLFDRNYITALTIQTGNSGLILGQPSDPRMLGVTLRAKF